jgi:hypothetical protein
MVNIAKLPERCARVDWAAPTYFYKTRMSLRERTRPGLIAPITASASPSLFELLHSALSP